MMHILSRSTWVVSLLIVSISVFLSIYVSPQMPTLMASHWSAVGEVNGYMSKFWGLFLMPLVSVGILLLFSVIPFLDPLRKNFDAYKDVYNEFVIVLLLFLLYIHGATILWNLGVWFDMSLAIVVSIGLLYIFIARMLRKTKRNWFVGIRTPWTLSSDEVWDKTHLLGSKLFTLTGLSLMFVVAAVPTYVMHTLLVLTFGSIISVVIYSYLIYKKIELDHD